jgi:tetratricopeptide (TPR) repeat protein
VYAAEALALARQRDDRPAIANALRLLGNVAELQNNTPQAMALYQQSLAVSRELGDPEYIVHSLVEVGLSTPGSEGLALLDEALARARVLGNQALLALVLLQLGGRLRFEDHDIASARALALLEEARALFHARGDRWDYAVTLANLGALARDQGDYARATSLLEEGLALAQDMGNRMLIADVSHNLGETALMHGDIVRAEELEDVARAIWREMRQDFIALTELNLGYLALLRGEVGLARILFAESFPIVREHRRWIPWWLVAFASVEATQSQVERAARLFGAAEGLRVVPLRPAHRREIARHIVSVRAQLGDAAFAAAWAAGQAMTLAQAVAEALAEMQSND